MQDKNTRMERYEECIDRFARWLDAQLNSDGSINARDLSCNAYMPLPLYADATKRPAILRGALAQIEKQFIRNGALLQPPARANMMPYVPAWLLLGAVFGKHESLRDMCKRARLISIRPRWLARPCVLLANGTPQNGRETFCCSWYAHSRIQTVVFTSCGTAGAV